MKDWQKLKAVTRHEFLTIARQPSFWMALLIVPLIILGSIGIGYLSSEADKKLDAQRNQAGYDIAVIDQSQLLRDTVIKSAGLDLVTDSSVAKLQEDVRQNRLDGLIVYPENIAQTRTYQLYVSEEEGDSNKASTIGSVGDYALQQSVLQPLGSEEIINLGLNGASAETISYENGQETAGFAAYIVPGIFLLLFYLALVLTVGYAMTSVSEEKENRAIEMVLSYVRPRTLMIGKLLGTTLITLLQFGFYLLVGLLAYLIVRGLGNDLQLPINLNDLVFDAQAIGFGLAYFVIGFLLYISMMLAIGAAFPTAKEAGSFTIIFYLLAAVPFWLLDTIRTAPDSLLTQVSTYFPLSAPTTLLIRNTVGNLSITESLIGLAVLIVSTLVAIWLAGKLFKLGALEYASRVRLSSLFKR